MVVPPGWEGDAIVERKPIKPVYNKEEWAAFRADPAYALKPDYVNRPEHWALSFPSAALPGTSSDGVEAGDSPEAPQILIHKAEEWDVVFSDGIHEDRPRPETIKRLRSDLDSGIGNDSAIRSPAFLDASLEFVSSKKVLTFTGGSGIRMICQWSWEPDLIRRGRLHYLFLGLSEDGTCQIIATFPLDHPDLPSASPDAEHLGRSAIRYEELEKGISSYVAEAKAWVAQNTDGFSPSLETLDGVVQSLNAVTWK